jgi:aminoglycoside phosphotransferase (APT) family kinase protein
MLSLHHTPLPVGFANPWLTRAFGNEELVGDAYHAPPGAFRILTSAARKVAGVEPLYVTKIERYIESRLPCFAREEQSCLVHADLHFGNLVWRDKGIVAVLDFEGSRPAPSDLELDTLIRFFREPDEYAPREDAGRVTAADFHGLLDEIGHSYPSLFSRPHLGQRLETYEVLWHLTQLHHFPPNGRRNGPWNRLCAIADTGSSVSEAVPHRFR